MRPGSEGMALAVIILLSPFGVRAQTGAQVTVGRNNASMATMFAGYGAGAAYGGAAAVAGLPLFAASYDMGSSLIMTQSVRAHIFAEEGLKAWFQEELARIAQGVDAIRPVLAGLAEGALQPLMDMARALAGGQPPLLEAPRPVGARAPRLPGGDAGARQEADPGARVVGVAPGEGPTLPGQAASLPRGAVLRGLTGQQREGGRLFENSREGEPGSSTALPLSQPEPR